MNPRVIFISLSGCETARPIYFNPNDQDREILSDEKSVFLPILPTQIQIQPAPLKNYLDDFDLATEDEAKKHLAELLNTKTQAYFKRYLVGDYEDIKK